MPTAHIHTTHGQLFEVTTSTTGPEGQGSRTVRRTLSLRVEVVETVTLDSDCIEVEGTVIETRPALPRCVRRLRPGLAKVRPVSRLSAGSVAS